MQKYLCSDNCMDGFINCQTDIEVSQTIISLLDDAVFNLWKESNEAFLDDLHTLCDDDDGEMEWDYRMEIGIDTNDVSIWLMQNDVTMTGVYGIYHGNLPHVGNITEDLGVTLRDNEEQSDSVQTACMSSGNVADEDADSSARAHREYASVEQVTHCTINSDNRQPTCYPQLVDCATQTETRTIVDRLWTGLAYICRFLYPILAQLIKIG